MPLAPLPAPNGSVSVACLSSQLSADLGTAETVD